MKTRVISISTQADSAEKAADEIISTIRKTWGDEEPAWVTVFASTRQPLGDLTRELNRAMPNTTILGASTAGEFTQDRDTKGATAVLAVQGDFKVFGGMVTNLKMDYEGAIERVLADIPSTLEGYPHKTAIVLLDALSGVSEETVLLLSAALGAECKFAGGAAADDLTMDSTLVGLNGSVAMDGLVVGVIFSKKPFGIGVKHGHNPISPPLKVTKADGAVVEEVEGRPAWEVWKEKTRDKAKGAGFDPDALKDSEDVSEYLIRYEAGIKTGKDYKIRVPLQLDEEKLVFACGIPQGSVIQITESVPQNQIESARVAAQQAKEDMGDTPMAGALVFDCICRNLILKDRYGEAVNALQNPLGDIPLAGFETYGEIAMGTGDMSGFHNTTTVVLTIPE